MRPTSRKRARTRSARRCAASVRPTWTRPVATVCVSATSFLPDFKERYDSLVNKHARLLSNFSGFSYDLPSTNRLGLLPLIGCARFKVVDSEQWINDQLDAGQRVLAEGAQGTLLDIDFRHLPLCDQLHHYSSWRLHGTRRGPYPHRRGHRHLQGVLHPRGLRPIPHRACTMKPVRPFGGWP